MLKIRKTKKEDLNLLAVVYKAAYDRPKEGEDWSIANSKKLLEFYFYQKTALGLTAVLDGKIVGAFLSFIKPWYDGNHLGEGELFIDPGYQGQKIGTKLFFEMMKLAKNKKCVAHELIAYGRVAHWYRKMGMKNSGLLPMSGDIKEILKKME